MDRPPLEVADVIRAAGAAFLERARMYFGRLQWKALNAILRCRTYRRVLAVRTARPLL